MRRRDVAVPGEREIELAGDHAIDQRRVAFDPRLDPDLGMGAGEAAERFRQQRLAKVLLHGPARRRKHRDAFLDRVAAKQQRPGQVEDHLVLGARRTPMYSR